MRYLIRYDFHNVLRGTICDEWMVPLASFVWAPAYDEPYVRTLRGGASLLPPRAQVVKALRALRNDLDIGQGITHIDVTLEPCPACKGRGCRLCNRQGRFTRLVELRLEGRKKAGLDHPNQGQLFD